MGTYRLEELWGEGAREDGRWSSPADEAPDRSPGDEEREMRRPHPSGSDRRPVGELFLRFGPSK